MAGIREWQLFLNQYFNLHDAIINKVELESRDTVSDGAQEFGPKSLKVDLWIPREDDPEHSVQCSLLMRDVSMLAIDLPHSEGESMTIIRAEVDSSPCASPSEKNMDPVSLSLHGQHFSRSTSSWCEHVILRCRFCGGGCWQVCHEGLARD
jgi:hypothetical protein